ncbi:MAG: hypothetical protein ACK4NR_10525 [Micavibrio sp.]
MPEAKNARPLNHEFIESVQREGRTLCDEHGNPVHHTHDVGLVAEYLLQTNKRHTEIPVLTC